MNGREDKRHPQYAQDANRDKGNDRRRQRAAVSAQITGHDFDHHRKQVRGQNELHAQGAGIDYRRIGAEDGEQLAVEQQQDRREDCVRGISLDKADFEDAHTAIVTASTVVLTHKRSARLSKGVEAVPRESIDVICGGVSRHNGSVQAVHGRLNDDVRDREPDRNPRCRYP